MSKETDEIKDMITKVENNQNIEEVDNKIKAITKKIDDVDKKLEEVTKREKLKFIIYTIISILIVAFSFGNLCFNYLNRPLSNEPIQDILKREAAAAIEKDMKIVLELFNPDAIIRDAGSNPPQIWSGIDQIADRYSKLPKFLKLGHVDLTISLDKTNDFARVRGSTIGEFIDESGNKVVISSVNGEEWTLKRIENKWKIICFTYNIW